MSQNKKRSYQKAKQPKIKPGLLLVLLGVLIALGVVFFALNQTGKGGSDETSGGTPKIEVDKTKMDFGDQHFGQTVTATFKVTNAGTGTLKFSEPPAIEVKEGC